MSDVIIAGRNFANIGGGIDKGIIVMWSGTVDKIPEGWQLCDGTNDTPDLRDRFIVGAGSSYTTGDIGGLNSVKLTVDQMPSHNHIAQSKFDKHSRIYNFNTKYSDGSNETLTFSSNSLGTMNISTTVNSTGGGAAHENRPPYYALCFIIKL